MKNKFSKKINADKDDYKMGCPEAIAKHIAKRIGYVDILDLCCGVGMNTVQFAKQSKSIVAIDKSKKRLNYARKNAKLYGVEKKIKFVQGNVMDEKLLKFIKADVVYMDPDWAMPKTPKTQWVLNVDNTQPPLDALYKLVKKNVTSNIVVRIAKTIDLDQIRSLDDCEIEDVYVDDELKFRVAYFGSLMKTRGQDDMRFSSESDMKSLKIKGYIPSSLIDYPGKICSIIFLPDCNFRCPFCQNPDLINKPNEIPDVEPEKILGHLKSRKGWLDGVCVGGGEPTLHAGLPEFLFEIKKLGFLVKLDTNGANPRMLKELLKKKLVDYIAMDIKAPIGRYDEVTGVKVNKKDIQESVDIIKNSGIDYEFRTTILPKFHKKKDLEEIGKWLKGSKLYCLQQFRPDKTLDESYHNEKTYTPEELKELAEVTKPFFKSVCVRGI